MILSLLAFVRCRSVFMQRNRASTILVAFPFCRQNETFDCKFLFETCLLVPEHFFSSNHLFASCVLFARCLGNHFSYFSLKIGSPFSRGPVTFVTQSIKWEVKGEEGAYSKRLLSLLSSCREIVTFFFFFFPILYVAAAAFCVSNRRLPIVHVKVFVLSLNAD